MSGMIFKIGTHDGVFHEDEVVAISILTTIYKNHEIVRSRNHDILDLCDFLVDVGEVYDHSRRRYDHHMPNPPKSSYGHTYSSAGLIWYHYGKTYLRTIGIPSDAIGTIFGHIRFRWFDLIDLKDNGEASGHTPISEVVRTYRPLFKDKTRDRVDACFQECVDVIRDILYRACHLAHEELELSINYSNKEKFFSNNDRVLLSDGPIPLHLKFWDTPVCFTISKLQQYVDEDTVRYSVNPIAEYPRGPYKIPIPKELLGLTDSDKIEEITGVSGIYHIHHTGFTVGCGTQESALAFCDYAIRMNDQGS